MKTTPNPPPAHMIADFPYIWEGPTSGCYMASLQMMLDYYGVKVSHAYLVATSGMGCGFGIMPIGKTDLGMPPEKLEFSPEQSVYKQSPETALRKLKNTLESLGIKIKHYSLKDVPWPEAWGIMKGYIANDIPVEFQYTHLKYQWQTPFVDPSSHWFTLFGYDEDKGIVTIYDPILGEFGEGIPTVQTRFVSEIPPKTCQPSENTIKEFKTGLGELGQFFVIESLNNPVSISLKEILNRDAELSLKGTEAICAYADYVEKGLGALDNSEIFIFAVGTLIENFGFNGFFFMDEIAGFLSGLASGNGDKNLEIAAYYYGAAARSYLQARALAEIVRAEVMQGEVPRNESWNLARMAKLIRRAADYEKQGARYLIEAAKSLS